MSDETRCADVSKRLESVKHLLWHRNIEDALARLGQLVMDLSCIQARSPAAKKVAEGIGEFETYIGNNSEFIPNFGRAAAARGNDLHGIRGIDDQPGPEPAIRKEATATDAVDATRGTPVIQTRTKVLN